MMPNSSILGCQDLSHNYNGSPVVEKFQLSIKPGECVAIMASSGAGKSTLARLLLGLEKANCGGEVVPILGSDVGVVFQEDSLIPWLDIRENICLLNELNNRPYDQDELKSLLLNLGLIQFENLFPRVLSTGMKQKVAISRLMLYHPSLYVIDEGMSNLDDISRFQVCDLVSSRSVEEAATILLITHNSTDALQIADRIILGTSRPIAPYQEFSNPIPRPRNSEVRFTQQYRLALEELRKCLEVRSTSAASR